MILNDIYIRRYLEEGKLVIDPWRDECIQPAGYDLHLHEHIAVYAHKIELEVSEGDFTHYAVQYPDQDNSQHFLPTYIPEDGFPLYPGQCILGRSIEKFRFPDDLVGKLDGCSSHGRIFLTIHSTAGKFDPAFEGTATFEIKNDSPRVTVLQANMRIAQMEFHVMVAPAGRLYAERGRYQGQIDPTPTRNPKYRTVFGRTSID